jgi:phosphoglycerate dehydrogenase-like enzyme
MMAVKGNMGFAIAIMSHRSENIEHQRKLRRKLVRVSMIGTGLMGSSMTLRLQASRYQVTAYNPTPESGLTA